LLNRTMKLTAKFVAAVLMVMSLATLAHAQVGTGQVDIRIVKAGFIVGVGGGGGTLSFNGRRYKLNISGISVGTIGISGIHLVGTASNLRTAADIAGSYSAASASVAVVGGAKVARLQNAKGVILELHGVQLGLEASLNVGGMVIALQ
jgi:hypothetical protein